MTSPDGITWTARTAAVSADWTGVAYGLVSGLPRFVAMSSAGAMFSTDGGVTWSLASSQPSVFSAWGKVAWSDTLSLFV